MNENILFYFYNDYIKKNDINFVNGLKCFNNQIIKKGLETLNYKIEIRAIVIFDSQGKRIWTMNLDQNYIYIGSRIKNIQKVFYKNNLLKIVNSKKDHTKYIYNRIYLKKNDIYNQSFLNMFYFQYEYNMGKSYILKFYYYYTINNDLIKYRLKYFNKLIYRFCIYRGIKYSKSLIFISNKYELKYYSNLLCAFF